MKRVISWFVENPVAANLLMWFLIVGGYFSWPLIRQEEFPNVDVDVVQIQVPYLGAAPAEVESAVCVRIEEAIEGIEGIEAISTRAEEGRCVVNAELYFDANKPKAVNEIKSRVDSINTLPAETEKPIVSELTLTGDVLNLMIAGEMDERSLKELGERVRDDLVEIPGISQVTLHYTRPYEISIEVSELTLRQYGLTLDEVARAVRENSLDIPGGMIKTEGGEVLLRTMEQAYTGREFEQIVVLTREDGTTVKLGDIATVRDGFEDTDLRASFDGQPAVMIEVNRVGDEDILDMAADIKGYVADLKTRLPEGITVATWTDESQDLVDRLDVLAENAVDGLLLVLVVLALFLRFQLALWVALGIPIAVLGTLILFPVFDLAISTLAVLGFILVLGILVDDAIVVGERIYAHEQRGKDPVRAAIDGTHEVTVPVIFGVLTTMATFLPVMTINTPLGSFFAVIAAVVIVSLFFSIIESQLILPSHLAYHGRPWIKSLPFAPGRWWRRVQARVSNALERTATDYYQPALTKVLEWRYFALAIGLALLIMVVGLVASGRIIVQFFPQVEGTRLYAVLTMPEGSSVDITQQAVDKLLASAEQLRTELDANHGADEPSMIKHIATSIGAPLAKGTVSADTSYGPNFAEVAIELNLPRDYAGTPTSEYTARWRELTGAIPDAVELTFNSASFDVGNPIDIQLRGRNVEHLQAAAARLREALAGYEGVVDITDTFRAGKQEVQLQLLPEARTLGLTVEDLGRQVRQAFYGAEVQRVQRGREDIRVMVRFPESERRSIGDLENMRVRTADGIEVPFASVAQASLGHGYSTITREDGARVVRVIADVQRHIISPEEVLQSIETGVLHEIKRDYPRIDYKLAGEAEEQAKATQSLARNALLALLLIYALLAVPLHSYMQPLVIMSAIPFGAIGAIVGHFIMGVDLVFFSLLGIVALSGVVVNSSLVLVVYINRRRAEGVPLWDAVVNAGVVRFRPIVLTSLTTFVGLFPLMINDALAVQFFLGMAVALGFGVLLATPVTLLLIPCSYLVLDDFLKACSAGWQRVKGARAALSAGD